MMKTIVILSALIGVVLSSSCNHTYPRVRTRNGVVEGFCVITSPIQVNAFLSIPFAEPPVRFQKPTPKSNWSGVLSTKVMPPRCSQVTADPNSEDCLYLNVFAPAKTTGHHNLGKGYGKGKGHHGHYTKLPVIVVVYGGAFATGGARNQGTPLELAQNIVAKGFVMVIIQYRVGPLGFCTTKDSVMPGNYGLWDATMAMQWVHDNIGGFGGDKDQITMYGGSAGAAMIEAMHLSPHATHLFHKMIIWSGAAATMWDGPTKENCEARAASLNLTWSNSAEFKSAMFSAPVSGLLGAWQIIGESAFDQLYSDWAPVYDNDFFPASGAVLRAAAKPKPIIFGVSYLEGAGLSGAMNLDKSSLGKILEYMVPAGTPARESIQRVLFNYYRDEAAVLEPTAVVKHSAQAAVGERSMAAPIDAVSTRYLELFGSNQTMYRYVFKHFNPLMAGSNYPFISFATHSYDQYYFLGGFNSFNAADQAVRETYIRALTNFAKTGNPNGSGASSLPVEWLPNTIEEQHRNYVFDDIPFMDSQYFHGRPRLNNDLARSTGTMYDV